MAWTTLPCHPLSYSPALQEQPVFIFKHTESFPAGGGSELSSLCPPTPPTRFSMRTRTVDSLSSSRSLLRLHLKRAVVADSRGSLCLLSWLYYSVCPLLPLGALPICLFIGSLTSPENVSSRAGTFCSVYFCVSSVWLIVGACVSRANGQAAQAQAGWNSVYVGKLTETGAITSPLLLIALPGTAQRSSEYRC